MICPRTAEYPKAYEVLDGIFIHRHPLLLEASGKFGYLAEYSVALFWEFLLAWKILLTRGFDAIHICNPPDFLFLVGGFFRLFGKKLIFDHHDLGPEVFQAKFKGRGFLW